MYVCRSALQRFSSLARHSITQRVILSRNVVPRRLMSSVPGGTGESLVYAVVCGGAFAAAMVYAYRMVSSDSARFTDQRYRGQGTAKDEWTPKPWPPKNAEEVEEVAEEAQEVVEVAAEPPSEADAEVAASAPVELVAKAEESASMVEKAAEVVAEAADVVEETAKEVAAVAHEVEKIAEEVETAAKELEAPALPVVEEATAESNVTQYRTELADDSIMVPVTETTVEVELEKLLDAPVTPFAEEVPVALVVEETPLFKEVPLTLAIEEAVVAPVVEDEPVASADMEATATPVVEEVGAAPTVEETDVLEVEGVLVEVEAIVASVIEEAAVAPVVEQLPVTPVVEEAAATSEVEEVPAPPAVEEAANAPVIEEAPVTQAVEEAHVAPVVEEAPAAEEAPSVTPEATEEILVPSVTEVVVIASETPVLPDATEVPVVTESSKVVADSPVKYGVRPVGAECENELSVGQVVAEMAASAESTAPPAALEDPVHKHEYVVVVLEGTPKTDKKLKVLGVSPMSGRIIPAPEDKEPAEQVTGQAPPA